MKNVFYLFSLLTLFNTFEAHEDIKFIKVLNKTHFSCDEEKKVLRMNNFNDDFCDCSDGSDENKTNACMNGKFLCSNRFYEPKIISTSKVNDGICDCCDGSDEFNLGCPKTCLDLSTKEYDRLMDNFLTLKMIVTNFNEDKYFSFFNYNQNLINKIMATYGELEDLTEKKFLLKSYLNKIENSMTEDNEEFIDSNEISLKKLRSTIENMYDKIKSNDQFINEHEKTIKSFEFFSVFRDINEDCHKASYKYFECDLCANSFKCTGYKGNKYRHKFLGNLAKFENNILHFENGSKCFYYNKSFSARVFIECGSTESLKFKEKINGCHYDFVYTTKIGCNSLKTKEIQEKIKLFLSKIQ